ncbi:Fanconi anemia group I protein-like [Porites lutea]|uniref:Fanconi anemia group I protein-like n=1 Tax=Porites lutea TaxID=51062 RepID=UPI003CC622D0
MDERIIRLCEENNVTSLVQALSSLKSQKVVDLFEARALEGRGEPVPYLKAVFKGSPCDTKVGLERRTIVFKHAVQVLNDGDVSNKVASEVVGFLLMELDAFPGNILADLADVFINAIKSGSLSNGKSLELFPKVLSAVAAKDSIPMVGECGGEMAGQEYKRHLLNTLCSSRWDPQCAIHLAAIFRDVPMTSDELRFVMEKIIRAMKDLDFQELPPLVYQLLLLSTKGHKPLILEGVTSFFNNLDETCRKENKEDSSEVQTMSKDQLRHMEGTVVLHITFAVKQDQDLGKEFIKYLKAHQSCPGVVLTPFNIALALSIAQIHRFEEMIFDFLKSAVLRSFKDEERRKQSKWVRENIPASSSVQDQVLETVQNSLFSWDHVTQGLVQLGFTLMDAFGPKMFDSTTSPNLSPTQHSYKLGSSILLDTFKAHEMVRSEILQQILNRVITKATTPVNHYIDLLASTVSSAPHVLLESMPRVKEALDYLSFLPPKSAEGFLKAIQPLLKISLSLRDSLILVLRKAMFSRQVDARKIAVTGFLLILKNFKILGGGISSSQPASQLSQTLSHSSQIQVDVHVRSSGVGNEALCLEILGNLRRCLTQQAYVRVQLYEGLFHVLYRNPQLQQPILDMFFNQFQRYVESDEDVNPPIKLEPCLSAAGDQVYLTEPLAHLLCYLLHSMAKCIESFNQEEDERNDSMEHILNELEDLFQSLVRRMNKSEMEDFELDKSADFSLTSSVGIKNNILALLVLGVYEVLFEYSFAEGELSTESTEEIMQLFGNYHQLSEILKEKANATGKKGRAVVGKQGTKSMLSLECSASLLRVLFCDTAPSHQQGLTTLRGARDLIKYAVNTALQKLKEINESGSCAGPGGSSKEHIYKHCCTIARVFWKHMNGESCLQEDHDKKDKGKKINSLCVEGFCIVVNIMCCMFPQKLPHFLCVIDSNQDKDKSATEETTNQDDVYSQIKKFQRLIISIISSPDEDGDISLKDTQSLVTVISLLAQHLEPDGQQFVQLQTWVHRICADHNVDDPSLTKCLMTLLYSLTLQSKTSAGLVRDIAQDVHSQLGDVDEEIEVEDRTHFAIVNPKTAAPTVALLLVNQIEKIVDEMEWALVKVKGDTISTVTGTTEDKVPNSPESCPRGVLGQAICHRLCTVVAALHELSQSALPDGPCTEAALKVLTKVYNTLGALAKYYLSLYSQRLGYLPAKFEKLVKMSGTHLSQQVYALLTYIQAAQTQSLLEQSTTAKNKAKDRKKTAKGQNLSGKAKVMKEVKSIPNLIYAIEQYERYLIQLSKKSKINLMEHFKRSTARDFRINGATLEAALREESSDEEDDDELNADEQDENKSQEEESKEPPAKKGKLMETNKKTSKLSLKQKSSKQPLSQGNK